MDNQEALDIIQALSEGVNPFSGEALAKESVCLNEAVNTALSTAVAALENQIKINTRRANQPAKAGAPWTTEEEQQLVAAFDNGNSITTIADQFERSKGSIKARLIRLGKIEA